MIGIILETPRIFEECSPVLTIVGKLRYHRLDVLNRSNALTGIYAGAISTGPDYPIAYHRNSVRSPQPRILITLDS